MNLFFDTSVLVAASWIGHPHHVPAFSALRQAAAKSNRAWMSQHSIAEIYATLTSAPFTPPIHPSEALRILEENILPHLQLARLGPEDYREVIRDMASAGWRSGRIYDALILRCAEKQPIDRLYTFNVQHFRELASDSLRTKITAPA